MGCWPSAEREPVYEPRRASDGHSRQPTSSEDRRRQLAEAAEKRLGQETHRGNVTGDLERKQRRLEELERKQILEGGGPPTLRWTTG